MSLMVITHLAPFPVLGHCGPGEHRRPAAASDIGDLRGLARGLRELFEIAASTLAEDAE
jgi:hypothetical protein